MLQHSRLADNQKMAMNCVSWIRARKKKKKEKKAELENLFTRKSKDYGHIFFFF